MPSGLLSLYTSGSDLPDDENVVIWSIWPGTGIGCAKTAFKNVNTAAELPLSFLLVSTMSKIDEKRLKESLKNYYFISHLDQQSCGNLIGNIWNILSKLKKNVK